MCFVWRSDGVFDVQIVDYQNDIALQRRAVTVDTAMRLVRYFGGDVQRWLNLQLASDLKVAQKTIAPRIAREVDRGLPGSAPLGYD